MVKSLTKFVLIISRSNCNILRVGFIYLGGIVLNHTISYSQLDNQEKLLVDNQVANKSKKAVVAWLLWLFLGGFGAHRFYMGRTGTAVVMLILSLTFFGTIISVPWMIIDAFRIQGWIHQNQEQIEQEAITQVLADRNIKAQNN